MKILSKTKIFLIAGLAIVLVGMVFLGIFGLNKTADYKESYEIKVSVNINEKNSSEVVKDAAEKYLSDNGVSYVRYGTQTVEDGETFIYKTQDKKELDAEGLKAAVQTALNEKAEVAGLVAYASIYKISVTSSGEVFKTVIAIAVAAAVVFLISLFTVKAAGATTVLSVAVISALLFVSLVSLLRIPAEPFFFATMAVAMILAETLSFADVYSFKKGLKATEKADFAGIKDAVLSKSFKIAIAVLCAAVIFTAVSLILGEIYLLFGGLQLIVAVVAAGITSLVGSPVIFDALRKKQ